jgi:hypothetical protein
MRRQVGLASAAGWYLGRCGGTSILFVALALGCSKTPNKPPAAQPANEEAAVRAQFAALQAALKDGDADKLWMLLDSRSQADAERVAKSVQATYAKGAPAEKTELEKALGLNEAELAALTGKDYLKTKRFQAKYRDVPGSTIEKIVTQGDSSTVHYLESDGDKEKAIFVRQQGEWKVWLTMPGVGKS